MTKKILELFKNSQKIKVLSIIIWIALYLFCLENFVNIKDSISSDLIYIESLYRDFFISDYSVSGWLVSKAPYYFPDWILYAVIRYISGNYVTAWYLYVFIDFLLILTFFYYILRYFNSYDNVNYILFTLAWGLGLIVLLASSPTGYGPHTFLFPVYHSGAMLNGLLMVIVWLQSIKKKLTRLQKISFIVFVSIATMSDLWVIIWFVIPICIATMILVLFKKLNFSNNIFLHLLCTGVFLGSIANPLLEKLGYLHFSNVQVGEPQSLYIENIKHLFKDLGELFFNSPLLGLFFIFTIFVAVTSIISSFIQKNGARKRWININVENRAPHLALHGTVLLSFVAPLIVIITFKMWGGWNYRYLHPLIILPWAMTGLYIFSFIELNKIFNLALSIFYIIFPILALVYLFTNLHSTSFESSRRGVSLAWINPQYPQEISCIDNAARLYKLKNGISEYWNAKKITETNKTGLLVNQFDYNLGVLHWMNNLEWYKVKPYNGKEFVKYDFIVTEIIGGNEFKKNVEKTFGEPSAQIPCEMWNILIYKDEKKERLNKIIGKNLDKYFNINNFSSYTLIKLFNSGASGDVYLSDWHHYPDKLLDKPKILYFEPDDTNFPSGLVNYIRFTINNEADYSFLEKHLKIDDIAGKNIKVTFYVRTQLEKFKASSIGYLVPKGKLDESAIFFITTRNDQYEISKEWNKIELNFSVPPIDKSYLSVNSFALIRPFFLDHKINALTIDIADVKLYIEDPLEVLPEISHAPTIIDAKTSYVYNYR